METSSYSLPLPLRSSESETSETAPSSPSSPLTAIPTPTSSSSKSSNGILANRDGTLEEATDPTRPLTSCSVALCLRSIGTAIATPSSASESPGPRDVFWTEPERGLNPGLGVRPRSSVDGEILMIGMRDKAVAGADSEPLGSGVEDFVATISSWAERALVWRVAMS